MRFRAIVPPWVEAALVVRGRMTSDDSLEPDLTSEPVRARAGAEAVELLAVLGTERGHIERPRVSVGAPVLRLPPTDRDG